MPLLPIAAALLLSATATATSDAELKVLRSSIRKSELQAVEAGVGGLAKLPSVRVDARLETKSSRIEGDVQLSIDAGQAAAGLDLCVRADRRGLSYVRGEVVALKTARVRGKPVEIVRTSPGRYRVPPLEAGDAPTVELHIPFVANLVHLARPQGKFSRGFLGRYDDQFLLTAFHPEPCTEALDAGPAPWATEPDWGPLANYVVSLVVPAGYTVVGSGISLGEVPAADGSLRFTRVGAAMRGFALAAFRGHRTLRRTSAGVALAAAVAADDEKTGRSLLDVAGQALTALGRDLGPYPWRALEMVVLPAFSPCFAFPGFIACGEEGASGFTTLVDHAFTLSVSKNGRAALDYQLGHAIAHQWLGGIIGSDTHSHPELDEPLATYLALLFSVRHLKGRHGLIEKAFHEVPYSLLRQESGEDAAAARPLSAYQSRKELVALLHAKGGLYHRALRQTVGVTAWHAAVRRYAREERFNRVSTDGVFDRIRASAPAKADALDALRARHLFGLHGDADLDWTYPD